MVRKFLILIKIKLVFLSKKLNNFSNLAIKIENNKYLKYKNINFNIFKQKMVKKQMKNAKNLIKIFKFYAVLVYYKL